MNESSSWTTLSNPVFRKLRIATVISGTCVAAHNSAATWLMNERNDNLFRIKGTHPQRLRRLGLFGSPLAPVLA
jgi:hypothetical protein